MPGDDHYPDRVTQPVNSVEQTEVSNNVSVGKLWTPFWLKRSTLSAFIVLYAILLACVAALWHLAQDQDGFTLNISTNHYTWTYGPTAVLIIVVSLWRQVEYHCKLLAPWLEMKKGGEASESLLLDYVSPIQFTSLWLAIKHGTTSVTAAIVGFACLKLVASFIRLTLINVR